MSVHALRQSVAVPDHQRERFGRISARLARNARLKANCTCGKDGCDSCELQNTWDYLCRIAAASGVRVV